MKGLISLSLYGQGAKYAHGAYENVLLAPEVYPGWTIRIYVERGHYAIRRLREAGAEIVEMDPEHGTGGMFWRFLGIDDTNFTHCIIRDADSRLNAREKAAVDEWIASGKSLHVIRDHPWHTTKPIIGGAWGMRTGRIKDFAVLNAKWPNHATYGDDEAMLGEHVWPFFYNAQDFLRHCHEPNSPDDTPFPPHADCPWHVCEPVHPQFKGSFRAVLLSPPHYPARRNRFNASLRENGGFLRDRVEWQVGTTLKDRVVPSHFDYADSRPHYYLASSDHLDIIERAILDDVEHLLVFEDDAIFEPDFEEYFLRMWLALPEGWKAAMLGGQPQTDHARHQSDPPHPEALATITGCLGMHGTLWSKAGLRRAFDHFHWWNRMTIDQAFRGLQGDEPGFYAPAKWIVGIDPDAIQYGQDG